MAPTIIDCRALEAIGRWRVADCCAPCHRGTCIDDLSLELDIGPDRRAGEVRLHLCCEAGGKVALEGVDFAKIRDGLEAAVR